MCDLIFFLCPTLVIIDQKTVGLQILCNQLTIETHFWPTMPFVFIRSEYRIPAHPVDIPQPPLSTCQCDLVCDLHITPPALLVSFYANNVNNM